MLEDFKGYGVIADIYNHIGDEYSKRMYEQRLLYSLVGDMRFGANVCRMTKEGQEIYRKLSENPKQKKLVFGTGFWGKEIVRANPDIVWECFVDNNRMVQNTEILGLNVISMEDLLRNYKNSMVVIGSRIYQLEILNDLLSNGFSRENILNAGEMLDNMQNRQYFDLPYFKPEQAECFVDGGCFDGKSSIQFIKWSGNKDSRVWVFEPDSVRYKICEMNLKNSGINVKMIPKGIWDKEDELFFDETNAGCSEIAETGKSRINVTDLDSVLKDEKVTFIKFDIEGAELNGIVGAEQIIREQRPKLAICIYHRIEDIWTIPALLLKYNSEYKFYLGHYSVGTYDTVLYAV